MNAMLSDRIDAGHRLAVALEAYRGEHPLVLAIPRGGVPIGRIVADALDGELDVVLVRKLGAPHNPEFGIGSVDERGNVQLGDYALHLRLDRDYVESEAIRQLEVIRNRRVRYSPHRPSIDPTGRTVIVVDDGLATGVTMSAALKAIRERHPKRLVCAIPVASPRSLDSVASLADDVVCLAAPANFQAVGQFYRHFPAVEEDEVISLISSSGAPSSSGFAVESILIDGNGVELAGDLCVPANAIGLVLFAHGSGSSRKSPRNRFVAEELNRHGLATLLADLLSESEDMDRSSRFNISLLSSRLNQVLAWATAQQRLKSLPIGLFGSSTGAAAALVVAAVVPNQVRAVVSRGGRPDLAGQVMLKRVHAPSLLIVGGNDTNVIALNKEAMLAMPETSDLVIVPGATHLFEEPGTLEKVAALAANWFRRHLPEASAIEGDAGQARRNATRPQRSSAEG
jgi:putative phosphoribosyl transferase